MPGELLQRHLERWLYGYAIVGSLVMTLIIWGWRQPFNSDGIVYLYAAQQYQQHGLHAALQVYSWPFFSILIAAIASLMHVSLLHAAYLLNLICDSITVIVALALAAAFGFSRWQQGLLLLLLLIFPWFNHFRAHILRGHGYYAASLLSMLLLIYHAKQPRYYWGIGFGLVVMIAMLFRIEGVFLLLFAPVVLLFGQAYPWRQRVWAAISCYMLPAIVLMLVVGVTRRFHGRGVWDHLGQIKTDLLVPMYHPFQTFFTARSNIAEYVLPFHSLSDSHWLLVGGLITLLLRQILFTLGGVYLLVALFTFRQYPRWPTQPARSVVGGYLTITLAVGMAFLVHALFLSDRYIALFVLMVILLLPPGLARLYARGRVVALMLSLLLCVNLVASVWHFGPSKAYIVDAGEWVRHHLPAAASVYLTDAQLAYYAGQTATGMALRRHTASLDAEQLSRDGVPYDYFVVKFPHKKALQATAWVERFGEPIKTFGHRRGGQVLIFTAHRLGQAAAPIVKTA